jgi:hypothetical protein
VVQRVIDKDAMEPQLRTLEVRGVGRCIMRSPTWRGLLRLDGHLDGNPFRADQHRCVDELISLCVREPRLNPSTVRRLPAHARQRLRLGALEAVGVDSNYRRLRGSHLSADERAYAALRWRADHRRAESEQLMRSLRDKVVPVPEVSRAASRLARVARLAGTAPVRDAIEGAQRWSRPLDHLGLSLVKTQHFDVVATTKSNTLLVASMAARAAEGFGGGGYHRAAFTFSQRRSMDEMVRGLDATPRLVRDFTRTLAFERTLTNAWRGFERAHRFDGAALAATSALNTGRAVQMTTENIDKMFSRQVRAAFAPVGDFEAAMGLLCRERPVLLVVEGLLPRWKQRPLAVLVDLLSVRALAALMQLEVEDGVTAVVDALTPAVTDIEVLDALQAAVDDAPYIAEYSREWLSEALGNVRRCPTRWVLAVGHLVLGVEGAFRDGARQAGVTRWGPRDKQVIVETEKAADGIEAIFRHLKLEASWDLFLRGQAYGGSGSAIRHATVRDQSSPDAARRQVTVLLLALAMGLERFADRRAMQTLLASIEAHARQLPLLLPDA